MQLNKVMTVDPGMNTGIAYWTGDLKPITEYIRFTKKNHVIPEPMQLQELWNEFDVFLEVYKPEKVYIEAVNYWSGSLKSKVSASRGNLSKLAYLVGGYMELAQSKKITVELIPVTKWKGQLTKEATKLRVKLANGETYRNDHITDAVGIGLSIMGIL